MGTADLTVHAGVECTKGRASAGACQTMTMKVRMVNNQIRNMITVGRCISVNFQAQAGGVATEIAVQDDVDVEDIKTVKFQQELLNQGSFLCAENFQPLE
jgi:hypothetical protein